MKTGWPQFVAPHLAGMSDLLVAKLRDDDYYKLARAQYHTYASDRNVLMMLQRAIGNAKT